MTYYNLLAEGPSVAREKKMLKKNFRIFLAFSTPRPTMSVHKKFQPNRSSRLAGYREHIYDCLVLLYRFLRKTFVLFLAPGNPSLQHFPYDAHKKYSFLVLECTIQVQS